MRWNLIYYSSIEVDKRKNEKELYIFCYYTHNHFFGSKDGILKQLRRIFKCFSHKCQIHKEENLKTTWSKIPFDFYRKHTWAPFYPILQAFLRKATCPSLLAKIWRTCWEKLLWTILVSTIQWDIHVSYLILLWIAIRPSLPAKDIIKECLEVDALDHTTFHHSAVSILFLISLQVEIHVAFPY